MRSLSDHATDAVSSLGASAKSFASSSGNFSIEAVACLHQRRPERASAVTSVGTGSAAGLPSERRRITQAGWAARRFSSGEVSIARAALSALRHTAAVRPVLE